MVRLAGAKFVLIWCFRSLKMVLFLVQILCSSGAFFLQNGAPSWCKICAHLVLSKLENGAVWLPRGAAK